MRCIGVLEYPGCAATKVSRGQYSLVDIGPNSDLTIDIWGVKSVGAMGDKP